MTQRPQHSGFSCRDWVRFLFFFAGLGSLATAHAADFKITGLTIGPDNRPQIAYEASAESAVSTIFPMPPAKPA